MGLTTDLKRNKMMAKAATTQAKAATSQEERLERIADLLEETNSLLRDIAYNTSEPSQPGGGRT
jgi:transcriptional regulator GlxA family with amidase domain